MWEEPQVQTPAARPRGSAELTRVMLASSLLSVSHQRVAAQTRLQAGKQLGAPLLNCAMWSLKGFFLPFFLTVKMKLASGQQLVLFLPPLR